MLYLVKLENGLELYMPEDEFLEFKETCYLLAVECEATEVDYKMYCISYYDYIDEEWKELWCTPNTFNPMLQNVIDAEVEYAVREFN